MSEDGGEAGAEPAPGRCANGRFGPGNPGRRAGSRNRMTQRLVTAILADFERNRETVLHHLRTEHSAAYARLVARFLPPGTLAGEEAPPSPPRPFAELDVEALTFAMARLDELPHAPDWPALSREEDRLLRETRMARLTGELSSALAALGAGDDRDNGESTVAEVDSPAAEAADGAPERW